MQYCDKTLTSNVNLDIQINGLNQDCIKFIPKKPNSKKQNLIVGSKAGFIQSFKVCKQAWTTQIWQELNKQYSDEEKSFLKSKKQKRNRILFTDGRYIKCLNKQNVLISDNQDVSQEYGQISKLFGDNEALIIQSQKENCLYRIHAKQNNNWFSLQNDLKLRTIWKKPYPVLINDSDYDFETKNMIFSSQNCTYLTDNNLDAMYGIVHSSELGRVKVFDLRKERFNCFQVLQPNSGGQTNQPPQVMLYPMQSCLVESKTQNELVVGTFFRNQYVQIDQILSTPEKSTCFGFGDIFKMEKKIICCGYKYGYQLYQENLNRMYEPLEQSLQNILIYEEPNNCEAGDFQNDNMHLGVGEFLISNQDGQIISISPQPDYKSKFQGRNQSLNGYIINKTHEKVPTSTDLNDQSISGSVIANKQDKVKRSSSQQPASPNKDLESLYVGENNKGQNAQNNQSQIKGGNQTINIPKNDIPLASKSKKQKKLQETEENLNTQIIADEFQLNQDNKQSFDEEQSNNKEQNDHSKLLNRKHTYKKRNSHILDTTLNKQSTFLNKNEGDNKSEISEKQEEQKFTIINNNQDQKPTDFSFYFKQGFKTNKKVQVLDEEMLEVEKKFQEVLNSSKQPFVISRGTANDQEKLSTNSTNKSQIDKQQNNKANTKKSGMSNEQRQELVNKLVEQQDETNYNTEELLKITEKPSPEKDQFQTKESNQISLKVFSQRSNNKALTERFTKELPKRPSYKDLSFKPPSRQLFQIQTQEKYEGSSFQNKNYESSKNVNYRSYQVSHETLTPEKDKGSNVNYSTIIGLKKECYCKEDDESPDIQQKNRNRLHSQSFNMKDSSFNEGSNLQILEILNTSNYGENEVFNKRSEKILKQDDIFQQSLQKVQNIDMNKNNTKSLIEQNVVKELMKNKLNSMNPLDLIKKNKQKNEEYDYCNQQFDSQRRRRSSLFLQDSNDESHFINQFSNKSQQTKTNQKDSFENTQNPNIYDNKTKKQDSFNASPEIQRYQKINYNNKKNSFVEDTKYNSYLENTNFQNYNYFENSQKNLYTNNNFNSVIQNNSRQNQSNNRNQYFDLNENEYINNNKNQFMNNSNKNLTPKSDELISTLKNNQNRQDNQDFSNKTLSNIQLNEEFNLNKNNNLNNNKQKNINQYDNEYQQQKLQKNNSFEYTEEDKYQTPVNKNSILKNNFLEDKIQNNSLQDNIYNNEQTYQTRNSTYIQQNNIYQSKASNDNNSQSDKSKQEQQINDQKAKNNYHNGQQISQCDFIDIYQDNKNKIEEKHKIPLNVQNYQPLPQNNQINITKPSQQNLKYQEQETNYQKEIIQTNEDIYQTTKDTIQTTEEKTPLNKTYYENRKKTKIQNTQQQPIQQKNRYVLLSPEKEDIEQSEKDDIKEQQIQKIKQKVENISEFSIKQNQKQDFVNNETWRNQIPSRSFLKQIEINPNQYLTHNKSKFIYDLEEIEQEMVLNQGYIINEQSSTNYNQQQSKNQNKYHKNIPFTHVKQYNPNSILLYDSYTQNDYKLNNDIQSDLIIKQNNISQNKSKNKQQQINQQNRNTQKINEEQYDSVYEDDTELDNQKEELLKLKKEIEDLEQQLKELQRLQIEQNQMKSNIIPKAEYKKEILHNQNRVRYQIKSQFKFDKIIIFLKTVKAVEIVQPENLRDIKELAQLDSQQEIEKNINKNNYPLIQITKCQSANEDIQSIAYEINCQDTDSDIIYFDLLYNEDGFSLELNIQVKFLNFTDQIFQINDKNKAFVLFQEVKQKNNQNNYFDYHSIKFKGIFKNQIIHLFNNLFEYQIPESFNHLEEFTVNTCHELLGINIVLVYQKFNQITFYSQNLYYLKCLQNRILSRFDENVQKISSNISTNQQAYIYHFEQIYNLSKFRKDLREKQLLLQPAQELVQEQGYYQGMQRYVRLLSSQMELNNLYMYSNNFDEICRMQLENIFKCYLQMNPSIKQTFQEQREQIDNLIFNLRVKTIYSKLFPLENASFVGN